MTGFNEQQALAQKMQEQLDTEISLAWASLLNTEAGRLVIWSILDVTHQFSSSYTGDQMTNFLEGERNVGLKILNDFVFPHGIQPYTDLLLEADERSARIERAIEKAEALLQSESEDDDG